MNSYLAPTLWQLWQLWPLQGNGGFHNLHHCLKVYPARPSMSLTEDSSRGDISTPTDAVKKEAVGVADGS